MNTEALSVPSVRSSVPAIVSDQPNEKPKVDTEYIAELTQRIKESKKASEDLESGLMEVDAVYRRQHPDLVSELHDLTQQLSLINHIHEEQSKKKAKETKQDSTEDTPTAGPEDVEKAISNAQKRLKKRITKLFRRLSNLCHPDKIRSSKFDPVRHDLNNLFLEGKLAYELKDGVTLATVHARVVALRDSIGERPAPILDDEDSSIEDAYALFCAEKAKLEQQLAGLVASMNHLANSILFTVLQLHINRFPASASNVYRGLLVSKIDSIKEQINLATTPSTN